MNSADHLAVRFHFLGHFVNEERNLQYLGGRIEMSHIDRDKISLPEIKGHLADHVSLKENWRLHWLSPGLPLYAGLSLLVNDVSCMRMSTYIKDGMVVDIYVGDTITEGTEKNDHVGVCHEEVVVLPSQCSRAAEKLDPKRKLKDGVHVPMKKNKKDIPYVPQTINEMKNKGKQIVSGSILESFPREVDRVEPHSEQIINEQDGRSELHEEDSDNADDDYQPNEEDSDAENSEAEEMRKYADQFRREMKSKKLGLEVEKETDFVIPEDANVLDDGGSTSEEDGWSYDEESDGEGGTSFVKRKSRWPRFNDILEEPKFTLGMTFSSRSDFKDACKRYGLVTFRHTAFDKDEETKVRAKCTWPTCKWSCYASKSSRSTWHHCVPRRNNKLVTSRVIAQKYGNLMKANPGWKMSSIKQTVLEEMMADVSEAKCKRARKLVFQQLFDRTLGEYSKVFDYQKELLRSNPGSTIALKLDPQQPDDKHVFQRFYVCFNACKRGFAAGCRKVIGLDGCFFKGECKGELICAIGRDANNGMYPVAWAVVEKECNSSWFWFLGLLIRDLNINGQGEGWVFISDQQKGLINAISDLCPGVEHRNSARHMYANWKKRHTDHDWKKMWWRCVHVGHFLTTTGPSWHKKQWKVLKI
uniref:Uncharacterized protein n=1 Tax=Avena sativa TaxID=4498 RepID=A0ACD5YMJ0_AVESA